MGTAYMTDRIDHFSVHIWYVEERGAGHWHWEVQAGETALEIQPYAGQPESTLADAIEAIKPYLQDKGIE